MNTTPNAQTANAPGVGISELLACPFCGGPANIDKNEPFIFRDSYPYRVGCSLCNCSLRNWYATEAEAIRTWNHRANEKVSHTAGRTTENL